MEQELELSAVIGFQGKPAFQPLATHFTTRLEQGHADLWLFQTFGANRFVFSGRVTEGLVLHPDNEHILYPLGTTIVLRHIITRTQHFLRGHDNDISVITVSNSGKYIASGQKTHSGF